MKFIKGEYKVWRQVSYYVKTVNTDTPWYPPPTPDRSTPSWEGPCTKSCIYDYYDLCSCWTWVHNSKVWFFNDLSVTLHWVGMIISFGSLYFDRVVYQNIWIYCSFLHLQSAWLIDDRRVFFNLVPSEILRGVHLNKTKFAENNIKEWLRILQSTLKTCDFCYSTTMLIIYTSWSCLTPVAWGDKNWIKKYFMQLKDSSVWPWLLSIV